jgi:hydrogenase-4 component F
MTLLLIFISFLGAALISLVAKRRGVIEFSSLAAATIALAVAIFVAINVAAHGTYAPFSFFSIDALSAIVMLIIACVGLAATAYSIEYLRQETAKNIIGSTSMTKIYSRTREYFILLNIFLAAMFFAVTVSSPIFAWIFIEATTLSTALLISFYNKPSAVEAAWKYLIVNSVGLLLGFLGTLLYFTAVNASADGGLVSWQLLMANATHLDPLIAKIAFVFVLIGYGTKIGFVPMHTWKPDAYSKAPAPLGALFSGALLPAAFIILLKCRAVTDAAVGSSFSSYLLIAFGIVSIAVAALIIFASRNYKRMLAYSSIENAGIMALGFGFGGLGIFAAMLHMIYHSLVKSSLFFSSGNFLLKYSSARIANVKGALKAIPVTSTLFLIGFFFITGAPPAGIFFTEVMIFSSGMAAYPVVSIVALFFMAILFVGFFHRATAMVFGEKPTDIAVGEGSVWLIVPPLALIALALGLSVYLPAFMQTLLNTIPLHY